MGIKSHECIITSDVNRNIMLEEEMDVIQEDNYSKKKTCRVLLHVTLKGITVRHTTETTIKYED